MNRRNFLTKGLFAVAAAALPILIKAKKPGTIEFPEPGEYSVSIKSVLNDDDVHQMLTARQAIANRKIHLTRKLDLNKYTLPVIVRCHIPPNGIRTSDDCIFVGNYVNLRGSLGIVGTGWNNVIVQKTPVI
jgi:hypothetical protein